jgi:hypothetical protein
MSITLTQALQQQTELRLFGCRVNDFVVRGDLGLGHDPAGPLNFAWIVAFAEVNGKPRALVRPLLLSVLGDGDALSLDVLASLSLVSPNCATAVERCWKVGREDQLVIATLRRANLGSLLNSVEPTA